MCEPPRSIVSVPASQVLCIASYATVGSDAAVSGPAGRELTVTAGSALRCQVRPASCETAVPMFAAAPAERRPSWNTATIVEPNEKLSGSTAVSCWLSAFVVASTERRRATVSQPLSRSPASALTRSLPAPQSTVSTPPKAACTKSLPAPALIVSGAAVPTSSSPRTVPAIVAAPAGATRTSARSRTRRRTGAPGYRRACRSILTSRERARGRCARGRQRVRR